MKSLRTPTTACMTSSKLGVRLRLSLWALCVGLAFVLSGCAAANAKIASRKGYVRFPEKHYASKEKAEIGAKLQGEASYYGPGFHGKQTASGEIFNQNDYTCAHKSLPFGTKLSLFDILQILYLPAQKDTFLFVCLSKGHL